MTITGLSFRWTALRSKIAGRTWVGDRARQTIKRVEKWYETGKGNAEKIQADIVYLEMLADLPR